jgi:hypothetical protein
MKLFTTRPSLATCQFLHASLSKQVIEIRLWIYMPLIKPSDSKWGLKNITTFWAPIKERSL